MCAARLLSTAVAVVAILLLLPSMPQPVKTADSNMPIKHVVIIVEENHSFDNYFGTYPGANGINPSIGLPTSAQSASLVRPFSINGTAVSRDLCHAWECMHEAYDNGRMDGFVYANGSNLTMGYFDYHQIPYYWDYASRFVLFDNFYAPIWGPSLPNHLYLIAGQSGGLVGGSTGGVIHSSSSLVHDSTFYFRSIVDELDASHVSWKYYAGGHSYLNNWNPLPAFASFRGNQTRMKNLAETQQFYSDVSNHALPDVAWVMPATDQDSEHPPYDISLGQRDVVSLINAVSNSDYWNSVAIFVTWDESGGWYDHVPPPQVDEYGYGFRVPCLIVSPFAKQGYVDHTQGDFTSLLKFIETLHSLPSLADRDASANSLMEAFDFAQNPRDPMLLPGPYVPNRYPVTPRSNNTALVILKETGATTKASATELPDVAPTAISIIPQEPRSGDNITVIYTVKNFGSADALNFTVALYYNSTSSNYQRVALSKAISLMAGDSITLSFPNAIRARAGLRTLTVVENDLASIPESDYQDSALAKTFQISFPEGSTTSTSASAVKSSATTTTPPNGVPAGIIFFSGLIIVGTGLLCFFLGTRAKKLLRRQRIES